MPGGDLYHAIGGTAGCHRLAEIFYAHVARDPVLRPLFPGKSMRCAIEQFSAFLVQFLGGPSGDAAKRWWLSLRESHMRFRIGPKERDAWMKLMLRALEDAEIAEPACGVLRALFEHSSAYVVNQGPTPAADVLPAEIEALWDTQRALDEAVAAVRRRDARSAIQLAEAIACDAARHVALLATMIASGDAAMLAWVDDRTRSDPTLVHVRYNGRTLLHAAAGAGCLPMVRTLLQLGADPNAIDAGGHTPLYSLGNECRRGGGGIARALVDAGGNVNACGGVQRCTPLHMAARRGNVEIAKALVECGANVGAADRHGDTPLDRATKCRKEDVAALLRTRT